MTLDLSTDVVTLTRQLCDIESVSRQEHEIADAVEAALGEQAHLISYEGIPATPIPPAGP